MEEIFFNRVRILFRLRKNYLYCRITVNKQRCNADFAIHEKVEPAKWDSKRQIVKGSGQEAVAQNMRLEKIRARIKMLELDLSNKGRVVSADLLKKLFLGEIKSNYTLLGIAEKFFKLQEELCGQSVSPNTVKNYRSRLKNVTEFLGHIRRDTMLCEEFNQAIALHFVNWLKKHKKAGQNHCIKNIMFVRQSIKYAMQLQLINHDPLESFRMKPDKPKAIVYLSESQLKRLEEYPFVNATLQRVRDVFVFCCHTGLSYSDVARFDYKQHVRDGWIHMERKKTQEAFIVPLSEKAKALMAAYPNGLPVISNVNMNLYLKEIAAVVELPHHLTVHHSRKTFGMLMLNRGVSLEKVSRMLGHTSVRITQASYAKITQEGLEKDLDIMFGDMREQG